MKECNQCGKCCKNYSNGGLSASEAEIDSWEIHRPDIARFISEGKIWMDPDTGKQLALCPWLKQLPNENKYTCGIYYDRPDDCKYYPVTIQDMIKDDCEMLEAKDQANPDQAQKALDKLMADSRPAFLTDDY